MTAASKYLRKKYFEGYDCHQQFSNDKLMQIHTVLTAFSDGKPYM